MPAWCAACMATASVDHELGRRAARLGRPLEAVGEAPPFEQLERDEGAAVGLADVVDLDDVGMVEPGDGLGLDQEPGAMLGEPACLPSRIILSATIRFSWRCRAL